MVLQGGPCGRVGRRRTIFGSKRGGGPRTSVRGPFLVSRHSSWPPRRQQEPGTGGSAGPPGSSRSSVGRGVGAFWGGSVSGMLLLVGQAPIAQSVERLHGKEKVYGSIPYWGSTRGPRLQAGASSQVRALHQGFLGPSAPVVGRVHVRQDGLVGDVRAGSARDLGSELTPSARPGRRRVRMPCPRVPPPVGTSTAAPASWAPRRSWPCPRRRSPAHRSPAFRPRPGEHSAYASEYQSRGPFPSAPSPLLSLPGARVRAWRESPCRPRAARRRSVPPRAGLGQPPPRLSAPCRW
jgi:hypothetical protein